MYSNAHACCSFKHFSNKQHIASLHFHKLMNDVGLSFMDSKAKNKESKRPLIGIENSAKRRQDIQHDYP